GGTADGINYLFNGASFNPLGLGSTIDDRVDVNHAGQAHGIAFEVSSVDIQAGATVDLSGGGELAGAGFISGRGGSVDILKAPLASAGPSVGVSAPGDKVYAIMPSFGGSYAPVSPEKGAGDPVIGKQITIGAGVPGLPAGTYTLLPSNDALLPGAFRIEIG